MRLFTGIDLPEDVIGRLNSLVDTLRPLAHLRWTSPYNFHLTTKFIGEWPEDRLPELIRQLKPLGNREPIASIAIEGLGWFPNPHHPQILWTGIKADANLTQLATDTDEAVAQLGVPRETRAFVPHLTLARVKEVVPLSRLLHAIAQMDSAHFGSFPISHFHLYESKQGPSGTLYTKLAEVPLIIE